MLPNDVFRCCGRLPWPGAQNEADDYCPKRNKCERALAWNDPASEKSGAVVPVAAHLCQTERYEFFMEAEQ